MMAAKAINPSQSAERVKPIDPSLMNEMAPLGADGNSAPAPNQHVEVNIEVR